MASVGQTVFTYDISFNAPQIPLLRQAFLASFQDLFFQQLSPEHPSHWAEWGSLSFRVAGTMERHYGKYSMSRELLRDSQCLTRKGQRTGDRARKWRSRVRTERLCFLQDAQPPVTPGFLRGLDPQHTGERCLWGRCQCPLRSEAEQVQLAGCRG